MLSRTIQPREALMPRSLSFGVWSVNIPMLRGHHRRNLVSNSTCRKSLQRVRVYHFSTLHLNDSGPFPPDSLANIQACQSLAPSVLFVRPQIIERSSRKVLQETVYHIILQRIFVVLSKAGP